MRIKNSFLYSFIIILFFAITFFHGGPKMVLAVDDASSSLSGCAPGELAVYSIPTASSAPSSIVRGPDGNLWFTENARSNIGKITTNGDISEFSIPQNPIDITAGQDGNLWFTQSNSFQVGKISTGGSAEETSFMSTGTPVNITTAADGSIWFTQKIQDRVGRIIPPNTFNELTPSGSFLLASPISSGPDSTVWFGQKNGQLGQIVKVDDSGSISNSYTLPTSTNHITHLTPGPNDDLWFIENSSGIIGMITKTGSITEYTIPEGSTSPSEITLGPDNNLWYTRGNKIGQVTTNGQITEYDLAENAGSLAIALGADDNLWFTDLNRNSIVQFSLCKPISTSSSSSSSSSGAVSSSSSSGDLPSSSSSSSSSGSSVSSSSGSSISMSSSSGGVTSTPTLSSSLSGVWKGKVKIASPNGKLKSRKVVLKLCVREGELTGIVKIAKVLLKGQIISQDVKSENEVDVTVEDKNGEVQSINVQLSDGQTLLVDINDDIGTISTIKRKELKKCL